MTEGIKQGSVVGWGNLWVCGKRERLLQGSAEREPFECVRLVGLAKLYMCRVYVGVCCVVDEK